jgi:putative thioredoxin
MIDVTIANFEAEVIEASMHTPVLVDFWAPWCAPCRVLGPVLERMAAQAGGRWELVKINTEEHPELAATYNIASIPAVKLFTNGAVKDEFVGALPEREIGRFLDKALPSPAAGQLVRAQELLNQGSSAAAVELLEEVLKTESDNAEARVLLARALLGENPERVASVLEPIELESEFADQAQALRTLARLAAMARDPAALPEGRGRDRFRSGANAIASSDYAAVLKAFIEVMQNDKQYAGGAAKEGCKALFQLLGPRHPVVEQYFRAFSSALHS